MFDLKSFIIHIRFVALITISLMPFLSPCTAQIAKPRVIVSTDIGGSDPDDYQSMVHLLMYADKMDIVGLISSPPHAGRKKHIHEVIDAYAKDYQKLKAHNNDFPSPTSLRKVVKQGATDAQEKTLPDSLSEGASWIISESLRSDIPVWVLVWGSITDVAQALHADPSIADHLRVYSIGSWNTVQDTLARKYIYEHHPNLWWIESDETFRGMYMGGYQEEDFGNLSFVETHLKNHGALGELFWEKKKDIKMGDTPSVLYLLHGDPEDPTSDSWGGAYIKDPERPHYYYDNQHPEFIENGRHGARTVNKFRKEYLSDWAHRMKWLK